MTPAQSQTHHLSISENRWSCQMLAQILLNRENLPKCMKNLALNEQQYCFAKAYCKTHKYNSLKLNTFSSFSLSYVISNLHGLLSICRTQKESFSLKRFLWSQQASSVSENVVVSIIKTFKLQTETISIKR